MDLDEEPLLMSDGSEPGTDYDGLLTDVGKGDGEARAKLFAALYSDLHAVAQRELRRTQGMSSLSATTVLHEAYLRLSGNSRAAFATRAQYFAYAAKAMRTLIIDHVRADTAQKRGGAMEFVTLTTRAGDSPAGGREMLAVNDALAELERQQPDLADVVDLKYFCGLSIDEIAAMQGVSPRTVDRNWQKARLFLHAAISDES